MNAHPVVVITGASSGIGLALAEEYAGRNARLVLAARSVEKLEEIAVRLREKAAAVLVVKTDVSVETDCQAMIEKTVESFGGIDILINNAGISMRAAFVDIDLEVIRKVMDINFWGTVYCTKYAISHLLKSKGSVVGVSSIAGFKGLPGRTGYSASKFAMHGFLDVIRVEMLKKGVHVMVACPGFTQSNIRNTALTKDGSVQGESPREEEKMMTAEQVAGIIARGVDKRKRTLVMTTQGKMTVLVGKFFPKLLDKLTYNHIAKEPGAPFL
ncbi:MAG: SDR family oxidoreductase [Bacteroidetes bacterium]|nr:SDR family oxidoreductase [Bacteroidota bacterium]MBU1719827.1 SDR family oxidoreductase [Bacteroidota bacterium]